MPVKFGDDRVIGDRLLPKEQIVPACMERRDNLSLIGAEISAGVDYLHDLNDLFAQLFTGEKMDGARIGNALIAHHPALLLRPEDSVPSSECFNPETFVVERPLVEWASRFPGIIRLQLQACLAVREVEEFRELCAAEVRIVVQLADQQSG